MSERPSVKEAMSRIDRLWLGGDTSPVVTRWLLILAWAASAGYALHYLPRGWFPHDLGCLGQPAERVLLGQWPHRDFDDVYTGGLAFLNALAFTVLGVSAMSMRWVLYAVFLAWVPTVWYVARRLAGPVLAAATTVLAAAWTLPMYAEAMPSWYNLFLATFGTAALFRWVEVGRARWLFVAGLAGGVSILFKVVGLYYVAGCLLFLAYAETPSSRPDGPAGHGGDVAYRSLVVVGALTLAAMVAALVVRAMGVAGATKFALPALAPALTMAWWVGAHRRGSTGERLRRLSALGLPFLAGVAVPVAAFALPYALVGGVDDLFRGVFVLPGRRLLLETWRGPTGNRLGPVLSLGLVLWIGWPPRRRGVRAVAAAAVAALGVLALAASGNTTVYLALWHTLWWLPPWVVLAGVVRLLRRTEPTDRDRRLAVLLCVFGLISLVEVPYSAPIYFFFAAPMLALLALALGGEGPMHRRGWLLGLVGLVLAFTVLQLNPGFIRVLGFRPGPNLQDAPLALPRSAGLTVNAAEKAEYETVVRLVQEMANGPYIYATPDCPEIYFLAGLRNPTRSLFEFLDPERTGTPAQILELLDRTRVSVVVINRAPLFSEPVSPELVDGLGVRYPITRQVGRFVVAWKAPAASTP